MAIPQHFVFMLVQDFTHIAFSCAMEPLRIANLVSGEELYRWSLVSEDGVSATCSNGTVTLVDYSFDKMPSNDRLFVLTGINVAAHASPALCKAVQRATLRTRALGGLCSGAWLLAKAGLLTGQSAAIHWDFHDAFMEQFPEVNLVRNEHVMSAIELMSESLDEPLSMTEISDQLKVSKRQLERLFGRCLNCSPKKYYMDLRLQRAQKLLIQTDSSVTDVAVACGFEPLTHFSRMYKSAFGVSPSHQSSKLS